MIYKHQILTHSVFYMGLFRIYGEDPEKWVIPHRKLQFCECIRQHRLHLERGVCCEHADVV